MDYLCLFQEWEDFHFTKEVCQNYGLCTVQNHMEKSTQTIRDSTFSMPVYTFINELHYLKSQNFSNKFIYTQY